MTTTTLADRKVKLPNGTEIAYHLREAAANGGSPPVVLLHGFCGTSAYWADVLPLLPEGTAVIVPDLRGHGSSPAPADDIYRMEAFADDIEGLIGSLGLDRVILFGHSLGGYIAAAFAERHPHRLQALGLVHPTALPDPETAREGRDRAAEAIRRDGIGPFVEELVPRLFAAEHLEPMADKVEAVKAAGRMTSVHGAAATALGMKERPDRSPLLESLRIPILLVAGARDGIVPQERTFSFASDAVTRRVLDGAGHMGMLECPNELAAAMREWIEAQAGFSIYPASSGSGRAWPRPNTPIP